MNKRVIAIIVAIIAIIGIAISLFIMKPWENNYETEVTELDTLAESLEDDIPNMDKEEIKEGLQDEMTDEQLDIFNDILDKNYIPEADENSEVEYDEENNILHYTDVNGQDANVTVDAELDSDKAQDSTNDIKQSLQNIINDASGNPDAGSDLYIPPEGVTEDPNKQYENNTDDYEESWGASVDEDGILDPNIELPERPSEYHGSNNLSDEDYDKFLDIIREEMAGSIK